MRKISNERANIGFRADNSFAPDSYCQGKLTLWNKGNNAEPYKTIPFFMQYKDYPKFIRTWRKAMIAKGGKLSYSSMAFNLKGGV